MTSGTTDKTFVDTNVLIYAHDVDAGRKHEIAKTVVRELWVERSGLLSTQVLQEFTSTRRARSGLHSRSPLPGLSFALTPPGAWTA